jgi:hypothetical protein
MCPLVDGMHKGLDACSRPALAYRLSTSVLGQHGTHNDPGCAAGGAKGTPAGRARAAQSIAHGMGHASPGVPPSPVRTMPTRPGATASDGIVCCGPRRACLALAGEGSRGEPSDPCSAQQLLGLSLYLARHLCTLIASGRVAHRLQRENCREEERGSSEVPYEAAFVASVVNLGVGYNGIARRA